MPSENITCWRVTNKNLKTTSIPFRVHREQLLSLAHKDQFEKKAKTVTIAALPPPGAFTSDQLKSLQFGDKSIYDIITSMVVSSWKYYLKQGQTIDYEILKRSAESPLTQQMINGLFFGTDQPNIFMRIEKIRKAQEELGSGGEERPDLFYQFIMSDTFSPNISEFMFEYNETRTFMLYTAYLNLTTLLANGYLVTNNTWFQPGSLQLTNTAIGRVNEAMKKLQEDPTYKNLTPEKALLHLDGKLSLKEALAPSPSKGGKLHNRNRKRTCKYKRKHNRTHKRLSTAKSHIMIGK